MEKGGEYFIHCHTGCHCLNPHHIASLIQHLTSLGRVGETTAQVEQAPSKHLLREQEIPVSADIHGWEQWTAERNGCSLSEEDWLCEYIDMVKLSKLLTNDPCHVYSWRSQAVSYIRPCQFCTWVRPGVVNQHRFTWDAYCLGCTSFAQDPRFCLSVMAEIACRAFPLQWTILEPPLMSLAEVFDTFHLRAE